MELLQEAVNVATEIKRTELELESFYLISEDLVRRSIENYEEFFVLLHRYVDEEKYVMLLLIIINGASLNAKFSEVLEKINDSKILYSILNLIDVKEYYPELTEDVETFISTKAAKANVTRGIRGLICIIKKVMSYLKDQAISAIVKS
ncbi:hypothetical protein [Priestia aryabhattai]